jgi:hypothetical protein
MTNQALAARHVDRVAFLRSTAASKNIYVYSVTFAATAFEIWLVDARQYPNYRTVFRAAATCVTRAP